MLCHSVRSCQLPSLSLARAVVASEKVAMVMPLGVDFTSGSLPRLPIRVTLLTPRAIRTAPVLNHEIEWNPGGRRPGAPAPAAWGARPPPPATGRTTDREGKEYQKAGGCFGANQEDRGNRCEAPPAEPGSTAFKKRPPPARLESLLSLKAVP